MVWGVAAVVATIVATVVRGFVIWFLQFPSSVVTFLPAGVSDHAPVLLNVPYARVCKPSFKFLNCWALSGGFLPLVSLNWVNPAYGSKIHSLFLKLRRLRGGLKHLHSSEFSGIKARVAEAKASLSNCQILLQASPLCPSLILQEKDLLLTYTTLKAAELRVLSQKAKVQHLKLSDANTHYFYASIAARRNRNTIGAIKDAQGQFCQGHKEVTKAFLTFYQTLLGSTEPVQALPADLFSSNTLSDSPQLEAMVTSREIELALFSIDRNKSPGVDGYNSGFFKDTWSITGPDFQAAVQEFFEKGRMPQVANSTIIALVPKNDAPSSVTEYRPISCCTVFYKTVSKILANRMKPVLNSIIGLEQAAFIEGRDLFDNSMVAHELAFKYNRSLLTPRCILKVDIRKAFDSVSWDFLSSCLTLFGFPEKFRKWILACVTTSHFSLSINGSIEGVFPGKRGLRQGDPLSPYLFVICMEVLSRLLRNLPIHPGFSYHPKCVQVKLTHLIFADDLLVFTRGDLPSVLAVDKCLKFFAALSGLQVNPMKSNLYFGGVNPHVKQLILSTTGYVEGDLPVRYLGLPLFSSRLTQKMFLPLLDKIREKISHWANHQLSYAGKIALINSVIFGLHNFWGASVLLPKGVAKRINRMCKDFLWGVKEGSRRMVFKSWESFCLPRQEGGMDIKEILSWNKSQLMVWVKKLITDAPNIWVKWVKAYLLKGEDFWEFRLTAAHSWFWGNVIAMRDCLLQITGGKAQAITLLLTPDYKQQVYQLLRTKGSPFPMHKSFGDSFAYPKHAVVGVLAVQNKLPTVDNLCSRGMVLVNRCVLCEHQAESAAHLFFQCSYSKEIWLGVAAWLRCISSTDLRLICSWFKTHNRGRSWLKKQRRCALLSSIYLIWAERNKRVFQNLARPPSALLWKVKNFNKVACGLAHAMPWVADRRSWNVDLPNWIMSLVLDDLIAIAIDDPRIIDSIVALISGRFPLFSCVVMDVASCLIHSISYCIFIHLSRAQGAIDYRFIFGNTREHGRYTEVGSRYPYPGITTPLHLLSTIGILLAWPPMPEVLGECGGLAGTGVALADRLVDAAVAHVVAGRELTTGGWEVELWASEVLWLDPDLLG
ncbi:uncharacterized protein LOC141648671 [Silene latifolia]|uniref:uncharacterized protein LOC141648671 n=1 Tax=Silene latifolia TaxID=37657 RepID=UPI003D7883ED